MMDFKSFWKITFQHPLFQGILAVLVYGYLRLTGMMVRWRLRDVASRDAALQEFGACIVCFWHDRLALMPWGWGDRSEPFFMLISQHSDGRFIADVIRYFGLSTIYGSARNQTKTKNKGGVRAYRALLGILKKGGTIGITPDGPRGPRHQAHIGVIKLAQRAGVPIIPSSVATRYRWVAQTWDRFIVPYPFKDAAILSGPSLFVPADATEEELEAFVQELSHRLNEADATADAAVGR